MSPPEESGDILFFPFMSVKFNLFKLNVKRCLDCFSDYLYKFGKCYKILNTFLFLFLSKILVIGAPNSKKAIRIANREDSDHIASSEAV